MSDTHELKTWPEFFQAVKFGIKKFEVRKNDRDFKQGDLLVLKEWDNFNEQYTGEVCTKKIGYILLGGCFGVQEGFVVLSLDDETLTP